ncbi:TOMM precursor leader peptide-binding protein [Polyangium jinanense]|uniref:TOMM leader peptide-binding protein n=1 Tax=Polyangium jinanense TaxID=2829994 RepID=A0A9X3X5D8_9BACT|nr:TOMM precursor leader peptide-binding protein [Polyangium jinanense]MDC3955345.1 TOMM precursor leader peptide-binding protein [Polyangium jinanense]MDC3981646.1 TOMM precursor leader peptide-binding protein [Polyangium jinanense]
MRTRPRFKHSYRIEILEGEGVYLLWEGGSHVLHGRTYQVLAPLLSGTLTEQEICERLEPHASPAEVFYAITMLRKGGFVTNDEAEMPRAEAAFWEALGVTPAQAQERLRRARAVLVPMGDVDTSALTEALAELSLQTGPDGDLHIVIVDDYLRPELDAWNRAQLERGTPWLLARPAGSDGWLGPLFIPGKTGCWRCLAHRLEGHRRVERYLERRTAKPVHPPALAALPSTRRAFASTMATAVARWAALGGIPALEGRVVTLDTTTFESRTHILVRRPQCPACGDRKIVSLGQTSPVVLEPTPRAFSADGGFRQATPEDTYERLAHHLSPVTGIVSRLQCTVRPEDDPRLVFSYSTDHNFAQMAHDLSSLRSSLRSYSGGKGRTDIQAKTGAICESIERYAGVFQGDEARVRAEKADLGEEAIDPVVLMGYSARQYAERARWNRHGEVCTWVPEPFDPAQAIEWSPVWSLTEKRRRFVPTGYCYYFYPLRESRLFTRADSNGSAAGNTRTEAVLQGFLELVERDAVALWWYNRLRVPGVDLGSFEEPYLLDTALHWRARGRELWALDLTSDLGIPTFAAISRRLDGPFPAIMFGFGAHLDARLALLRAVTEHNQLIPFAFTGDAGKPSPGGLIVDWLRQATLDSEPYLQPSAAPPRTPRDFALPVGEDLREAVEFCVERARDHGLETLVLDQTRPDTGLVVVKVIVPGLRHFWARFGPGRLYDVPVSMGRLEAPLPEESMNPHPMFI